MPTLPGDKDPLTQPGGWSGAVSLRKTAIQPQEGASLMDSIFAAGEEALLASPVSSIARMDELRAAKHSGRQIGADDARAQIESRGLKGHLTIPDQGVTQDYLDILINRKEEELRRGELIASAPQGFGAGSARFGASFVASMFDPINVASAFVPVVGQARYLKWLGAAKGIAGRTAVRAGVGATEGLAGAALVEPLIAMAKDEEQADYDMADSLANIAFGTVFGGGLHVVGGAGGDLYRRVTGATNPWDLPELKAGREAHKAIYDDVYAQLRGVGRAEDEAAANASLVASAFRSLSEVTGRDAKDLYATYGPELSLTSDMSLGGAVFDQSAPRNLTQDVIQTFADAVKRETGVAEFDLRMLPSGFLQLETIATNKAGGGVGTRAMEALIRFADERGLKLVLNLAESGYQPIERGPKTSSPSRLAAFYRRFGFVENSGRRRDDSLSFGMYRDPARRMDQGPRELAQRGTAFQALADNVAATRGQIRFGSRVNISLFQRADRSTFLHETGHLFLKIIEDIAGKADAPQALKDDLAKLRDWMGLKEGEAIDRVQHEQFARGLEAYVMEGKAPTPKLKKAFDRFSTWLTKIYKDIRGLDVKLSDDVRGVYDRLIGGYDAAKKAELAGPAKREAALKAAIAQTVRGKRVNGAEPIINGDADAAKRAAQNEVDALAEPLPEPLQIVDDDTGLEAATEALNDVESLIRASGDERAILALDELDEITANAKTWAKVARGLAQCIGGSDG